MNAVEKLVVVVKDMRKKQVFEPPCRWLGGARLVLEELPVDHPQRQFLVKRIENMLALCRAICREFNNLRSETARLAKSAGVDARGLTIGPMQEKGNPPKCEQCKVIRFIGEE